MMKVIVAVLMIAISGCAVYDGGKVPKTTLSAYDDNGSVKPTLSYSSTAMGGLSSEKELPESSQSIIEGEFLSVLEAAGYFGRISKQDDFADITIDVTLTNSGNPAAMIPAFITGLSLYIIPSWVTDNYDLVANVERKDGFKKKYVLADSVTLVQWLPMIFVYPTKNLSVIPKVRKNMYKKVLFDMKRDGFFDNKNKLSLAK